MTAQVQVLTLLSKVQKDKGIYAVSFDVSQRKGTDNVKKKRQSEKQVGNDDELIISM